jgi:hypothetical protein
MPRNGSGTYSLPAGNPVVSGTLIEATWANSTLSDLASAMTDSLSRNGEGGMLAPLRFADGTVSTPGVAWTNETSTGFYRNNTGDMRVSLQGVDVSIWNSTGLTIPSAKALTALGNATVGGTLGVTGLLTATGGVSGNVTGNASTATTLQTARNINGVSFNGSANIDVNTVNSVTFNNAGAGDASGTTFNGGAARTISYNTVGAPSTTGTGASGTWAINVTGNAATVTNGVYTTGDQTIGGNKDFTGSLTNIRATNTILTSKSTAGYGAFWAEGSGTNESYVFFANATGGERSRIRVDNSRNFIVSNNGGTTSHLTLDASGNLTASANITASGGTVTIGSSALAPTGTAPSYTARAWVNFNGTGTVAIRSSGNVSSITDNGVGDYTINFATSLPDDKYSMGASGRFDTNAIDGNAPFIGFKRVSGSLSASSANITVLQATATPSNYDCDVVTAAFFR